MKKKKSITEEQRNLADKEIKEKQKEINYDTKDFTIEHIVNKFREEEFYVPPYQRKFIWDIKERTAFIESVLLGLPTPLMFLSDCEDGRYEIVDGSQRIQTLNAFTNNEFVLTKLEKLKHLEGFSFDDLLELRKRKFKNKAIRVVVLEDNTSNEVRKDLFLRINTYGIKANTAEVIRGAHEGEFIDFIEKCSQNDLFKKLAPMSKKQEDRYERFELVSRFFVYSNSYEKAKQEVAVFLNDYIVENKDNFDKEKLKQEFEAMLRFVEKTFHNGFAKGENYNTTPRVRFEALAIGSILALREKPDLQVSNIEWLESPEFKVHTTSDASNSQGKLKKRIEYVRDKLLEKQ